MMVEMVMNHPCAPVCICGSYQPSETLTRGRHASPVMAAPRGGHPRLWISAVRKTWMAGAAAGHDGLVSAAVWQCFRRLVLILLLSAAKKFATDTHGYTQMARIKPSSWSRFDHAPYRRPQSATRTWTEPVRPPECVDRTNVVPGVPNVIMAIGTVMNHLCASVCICGLKFLFVDAKYLAADAHGYTRITRITPSSSQRLHHVS